MRYLVLSFINLNLHDAELPIQGDVFAKKVKKLKCIFEIETCQHEYFPMCLVSV